MERTGLFVYWAVNPTRFPAGNAILKIRKIRGVFGAEITI